MKFSDVLNDIRKLSGIRLKSIRPGADIIIETVENDRVVVKASDGRRVSRRVSELGRIWSALCEKPAVHVDSLLGGSGSSRNQPETIMANLPYVEFLWLDGKKNLIRCDSSHQIGTILEASHERREEVAAKLKRLRTVWGDIATTVIFSKDPAASTKMLEEVIGQKAEAVELGLYSVKGPNQTVLIAVIPPHLNESGGTYMVMRGVAPVRGISVELAGKQYLAVNEGGVRILIEKAPKEGAIG